MHTAVIDRRTPLDVLGILTLIDESNVGYWVLFTLVFMLLSLLLTHSSTISQQAACTSRSDPSWFIGRTQGNQQMTSFNTVPHQTNPP